MFRKVKERQKPIVILAPDHATVSLLHRATSVQTKEHPPAYLEPTFLPNDLAPHFRKAFNRVIR